MAHPLSLNLFDVLDWADALSQGTFLPVVVVVAAGIAIAFGVVAHERKRANTDRRTRRVRADVEQEHRIDAGREALGLDQRDIHPPNQLERVLRAALTEEAGRQTLNGRQPAAYRDDLHDVFEEDGRD